jgi:hypothetical protein
MQFDHYKLHLTFSDGTTETICNKRIYAVIHDSIPLIREAVASGLEVSRLAYYKVFGSDTDAGPYELLILED